MSTILVPGTYDPPTKGHESIWKAFSKVGDVIIAIGKNVGKKQHLFSIETRAELCRRILAQAGIEGRVIAYDGPLVKVVADTQAAIVVRGIRNSNDVDEGLVFADHLSRCGSVPVVFAPSPAEMRGVSSSLVKQLLNYLPEMKDELKRLLPDSVYQVVNFFDMKERFASLWKELRQEDVDTSFEQLLLSYSTPNRAYHTLEHIRWALVRFDELVMAKSVYISSSDKLAAELAIWFHDIILEGKPTDEKLSADAAYYAVSHAAPATATKARNLVLATSHDNAVAGVACVVVDADLSILASDEKNFDHYEAQVREEWRHVSESAFREGRAAIMQRFMDREFIYNTEYARKNWESKAKANLERSLKRLRSDEVLPRLL